MLFDNRISSTHIVTEIIIVNKMTFVIPNQYDNILYKNNYCIIDTWASCATIIIQYF